MTESRRASASAASSGVSENGDVLLLTGATGAPKPKVDDRAVGAGELLWERYARG